MATNEELQEQLTRAQSDIRTLAEMAGARARQEAQRGPEYLDALSDEARDVYDRAAREGARARQVAETQVRDHPAASLGLAFAAGALITMVLGRR